MKIQKIFLIFLFVVFLHGCEKTRHSELTIFKDDKNFEDTINSKRAVIVAFEGACNSLGYKIRAKEGDRLSACGVYSYFFSLRKVETEYVLGHVFVVPTSRSAKACFDFKEMESSIRKGLDPGNFIIRITKGC